MNIILVIVIACFSLSISFAQVTREWARYYNGPANLNDYAKDTEVDTNGYIYVAGTSDNGVGGSDITLVKYDSSGQQLWVERYNLNNGIGEFERSTLDDEGNIILTGYISYNYDSVKVITIKYNPQGQLLWSRIFFNPDYFNLCRSITTDNDGNIYVVGRQDHRQIDAEQIFTIKYNGSGDLQWVKYYGSQGYADIYDLDVDTFGNVYISGVVGLDNDEEVKIITIKYTSAGVEQWVSISDTSPYGYVIDVSLDDSGNICVVGSQYDNNWNDETFIMKYNNSGSLIWAQIFLGQYANKAAVNSDGDIYFTSSKYVNGLPNSSIVKYNSAGVKQWESTYEHPASLIDLVLDETGNVYAAGFDPSTIYYKYLTVKYNSDGIKQWAEKNDSINNAHEFARAIALDKSENVYVAGYSSIAFGPNDCLTIKYSQQNDALHIIKPAPEERLVTGEKYTIEWTGGQPGQLLSLDYSTDKGQSFLDIAFAVPAETGYYEWDVPFGLLTTKAKIKITDIADTNVYALSDTFKIKGYVLTRYDNNGDYLAYRKLSHSYVFENDSTFLWYYPWWQQFDYSSIDPFTGFGYLAGGTITTQHFLKAKRFDFPDWVSWVRTFGVDKCYYRTSFPPSYSPSAVLKWRLNTAKWGGSCFGMSTSNALLFKHKDQLLSKYSNFPNLEAGQILPADNVTEVINELFTHQMGNEHRSYRKNIGLQKTPNETLNDIKRMLIDDEPVRTLSIVSNDPQDQGGHSIQAYKVEQDSQLPNIYYVYVYDNSYPLPFDDAIIVVDTAANNGKGAWFSAYAWQNWGGNKYFYLREPAIDYLTKPSLPENQLASPFFLENTELQIYNTRNASITITDEFGNSTGYVNGTLLNEIPNSFPEIIENGSSGPPIGYYLTNATYSVKMENYNEEPIAGFFTGNKAFMFSRNTYQSNETDNLFFDGSVSYANPDTVPKQISLMSIFGEVSGGGGKSTSDQISAEKAYAVSNLLVAPNDSIVLDYSYDEKLILKNFGGAKNYVLSVELASEFSSGSFRNENITLPPNSSHTIIPDWNDMYNSPLQILVDEGNDGVFDDTLHVDNLLGDPVPVELLTFTAVNISSGVKLNWQTSTETNNYGFEVERKTTAPNNTEGWNKLGFVPGAGNSNSPKLYSYTDKTAKEGKYQYRLKQIDADGKYQFSKVIEIDVKNVPLVFALEQNYPNPFNPSTTISWQSPVNSHQTLKVYDVLGNEIAALVNELREAGKYEITFDASKYNLSSGVYFYQLKAEGFSAVKKFILAK